LPTAVFRDEVKRLVDEGAQLVEVLPAEEYEEEHLPGKTAKRMRDRGASAVLVTTSDGKLMGVLYREDAERLAHNT
jgi:rhodanese-related sulfurtransferase